MPAFCFDSSALVKCYVIEIGSSWVRGVLSPASNNDIHALRIAEIEVTSAIVRRRKTGGISVADAAATLAQLRQDIASDFIVVEFSDQLVT